VDLTNVILSYDRTAKNELCDVIFM